MTVQMSAWRLERVRSRFFDFCYSIHLSSSAINSKTFANPEKIINNFAAKGAENEPVSTQSGVPRMPVRVDPTLPPPANSKQPGITKSLLYNGSKFQGFQKSKGNSYEVEVVLQVICSFLVCLTSFRSREIESLSLTYNSGHDLNIG